MDSNHALKAYEAPVMPYTRYCLEPSLGIEPKSRKFVASAEVYHHRGHWHTWKESNPLAQVWNLCGHHVTHIQNIYYNTLI
jgi:hypothetical protein